MFGWQIHGYGKGKSFLSIVWKLAETCWKAKRFPMVWKMGRKMHPPTDPRNLKFPVNVNGFDFFTLVQLWIEEFGGTAGGIRLPKYIPRYSLLPRRRSSTFLSPPRLPTTASRSTSSKYGNQREIGLVELTGVISSLNKWN